MENTIIKEYRKETRLEKGKDGVLRPRTRAYTQYTCGVCGKNKEIRSSLYSETKPCKDCQKRLRGKTNFFKKAYEKFGNAFDLTKAYTEYYDTTTHVTVRCVKHNHEYKIAPVRFISKPYPNQPAKGGCPKCAYEVQLTKNKQSIDFYLALIEDHYPSIKVTDHGNADSNLEHIKLQCPIHGSFTKTLAKVLQSTKVDSKLCDKCTHEQHAWRTRMARTDIPGIVYFVKFKDVNLYKCGVTYRSVKDRLRGHLNNIEILWEIPFSTLSDAYYFEAMFFRKYYALKCNHPDSSLGGYTEFFSSFTQKPLQPFIEEILCRKESNSGKLPPAHAEDNPEPSLTIEEGATTIPQGSTLK